MKRKRKFNLNALKFDRQGLIPAIIQDCRSKEVLMLAYMNREALRRSLKSGQTCFWSRSRKKYWVKGETSGNYQFIKAIAYDCDKDALLVSVRQKGVACHTGNKSCFYRKMKLRGLKPAVSWSEILSGQAPSAPLRARFCGRECIK